MKYGMRTPSVKKSFKASTAGRIKREAKKSIIPGYGKNGIGFAKDPKKSIYNSVYHKATVGVPDSIKSYSKSPFKRNHDYSNSPYQSASGGIFKRIIEIFLCAFGAFGIMCGLIIAVTSVASGVFVVIVGSGLLAYGIYLIKQNKRKILEPNISQPDHKTLVAKKEIDGKEIAYFYDHMDVAGVKFRDFKIDYNMMGDEIKFVPEPENEYDEKAIKIMWNDTFIGYVHKNFLQGMILDWIKRGDPIQAAINDVDLENQKITFMIALYRKSANKKVKAAIQPVITSLIGMTKKDDYDCIRQDNIDCCEEGDELGLFYDSELERYIVSDGMNEIGEMNSKISEKLYDLEDDYNLSATLEKVTENESGNCEVKIKICFDPN